MRDIIIDEEFKSLLPALDEETYTMLEENLLQHGCRDALILWNGILIDGYNRFAICTKHNISFNTVDKEFDSREEVLIWIISNQISRRNLSPIQLSNLRGLHYIADKKIQGTNNQYALKSENRQSGDFQKTTRIRLSKQYRVSPRTIDRDAKLSKAITAIGEVLPEAKLKILNGEASIDKQVLERLSTQPPEIIKEFVATIENGTYKEKKSEPRMSGEQEEFIAVVRTGTKNLTAIIKNGDKSEIKTAIRSNIGILEDLYNRI